MALTSDIVGHLNTLTFTCVVGGGSFAAGLLGALTGLGGGVVIVPLLAIALGVDMHYAIGASLVSVIATSSGAAAVFMRDGYSNIRVAMLLEVATTLGALSGALLSTRLSSNGLAIVFGLAMMYAAYASRNRAPDAEGPAAPDRLAAALRLDSSYPTVAGPRAYHVQGVPVGFAWMYAAGILSGLLGIGSGAVKVLAMDHAMRLPFKVSAATSNFMIGVTAAASAGVYLHRGYIDPVLTMPVVLGVLLGAMQGARILARTHTRRLRAVFAVMIVAVAFEMLYKGITGTA